MIKGWSEPEERAKETVKLEKIAEVLSLKRELIFETWGGVNSVKWHYEVKQCEG